MSDHQGLHTLAEAAQLTGLSVEALRLRVKRGKLAAEKGNDGHPRVRLTSADLESFQRLARRRPTWGRQDPTDTNKNSVLEDAVGALREQLERERSRADQAEARAGKAEAEAAQLREERNSARIQAAVTEAEVKGLKEALSEARRPFWARWLGR